MKVFGVQFTRGMKEQARRFALAGPGPIGLSVVALNDEAEQRPTVRVPGRLVAWRVYTLRQVKAGDFATPESITIQVARS